MSSLMPMTPSARDNLEEWAVLNGYPKHEAVYRFFERVVKSWEETVDLLETGEFDEVEADVTLETARYQLHELRKKMAQARRESREQDN
jgi:exonuclease VII small subunit